MRLEEARRLGMEVVAEMSPACDRIVIAGSVRRGKAEPKDVEIVYITSMVERQVDMFTRDQVPATVERLDDLVRDGFWCFDPVVKRNGPKYQRMIRCGATVELFRAEAGNWGLVLALRTGPGDFNRLLVDRCGGAMPLDMRMERWVVVAAGEVAGDAGRGDVFRRDRGALLGSGGADGGTIGGVFRRARVMSGAADDGATRRVRLW